jgi:transcriptional regulator with XRE-family HTH domain
MDFNIKRRHIFMLKRKERKITHKEIANAIGVTQSAISQYETGRIILKPHLRQAYEEYIQTHDNRIKN